MSQCQQRCKRQLGRVIRSFYQFVTGTLSQGRCCPGGWGLRAAGGGLRGVVSAGLFGEGGVWVLRDSAPRQGGRSVLRGEQGE